MPDDSLRLFFALPLAGELTSAAVEAQRRLEVADAKVRWVEPENLHFTLKFLGEMPGTAVEPLTAIAARVAETHTGFALHITGIGAFPRPTDARAIWLGCREGAAQLTALATHLDQALARARLAPPEPRPYRPHLTIGRNKSTARSHGLLQAIEDAATLDIGHMPVAHFVLMCSELKRGGPLYTVLARMALAT